MIAVGIVVMCAAVATVDEEGDDHVMTLFYSKYLLSPHSCACEVKVISVSLVVGGIPLTKTPVRDPLSL